MSNPPQPPSDGIADDFFEQIFSIPGYASGDPGASNGDGSVPVSFTGFPLGLSLEQGRSGVAVAEDGSCAGVMGKRFRMASEGRASSEVERDSAQLGSLFPVSGHMESHQILANTPQILHGQLMQLPISSATQPPAPRPRVRARRGQATDPHSIAERLRRERIAERMRALQELVPNTNKTDRAAMLDEIVDYVKFLRLQVKVLSMSRLSGAGAGAGAQLAADIPISQAEGDSSGDAMSKQQVWEKCSNDSTEGKVAKLMEEDVGAAMQFLQSKALCMMPISLAAAFFRTQNQLENPPVKSESEKSIKTVP